MSPQILLVQDKRVQNPYAHGCSPLFRRMIAFPPIVMCLRARLVVRFTGLFFL